MMKHKLGTVRWVILAFIVLIPIIIVSIKTFAGHKTKGRGLSTKIECLRKPSSEKCRKSSQATQSASELPKSATPSASALFSLMTVATNNTNYTINVLIVKYFPLSEDKRKIDIKITGDVGDSYELIRQRTIDISNNMVQALQRATTYLGYRDSSARPALTYRIIDTNDFTQAVPLLADGTRRPDYFKVMKGVNICNWVEKKGVSEVWLWAYQGPNYPGSKSPYLGISESKMAGPYGDISNSPRYNDMPVCKKTYRVYTFNYGRGSAEAMESWGHQLEAELKAVDISLFSKFQGPNYPQTLNVVGRCGSVHNPPNARNEYDRANNIGQRSDCLDWNPNSFGSISNISCANWGCDNKGDNDNPTLNYMIWNWQNLPGRNNTKTYLGKSLRNWWDVHGDFDNVMGSSRRLTL